MSKRSARVTKRSTGDCRCVEVLEPRAYLNGVELGTPITSPVGGLSPASISVTTASGANADFNGDGKTDLALYDFTDSKVGLYLGNGDGSFQSPAVAVVQSNSVDSLGFRSPPTGPVAIADMNGDGKLDIVVGGTGHISIVRGDGAGGLGAVTNIDTNVANDYAIAVADLNGDGLMDILTSDAVGYPYFPFPISAAIQTLSADPPTVEALIQQPDGSFVQQNVTTAAGYSSMAVADFNGDGRPDLALSLEGAGAIDVMLNNGDGTFGSATQYAVGAGAVSLVAADFNADGKLDLVTMDSGGISFLAGNGDGTFKSAATSSNIKGSSSIPPKMIAAPLNNSDTLPDLLINEGGSTTSPQGIMALNNGDGTFHTGTTVVTGGGTSADMVAGKLNASDTLTSIFVADSSALTSLSNVTTQDTTPPSASLQATAPVVASPTYQFTINFSDDKQVDASTLGPNSITVTGPDGTVLPVTVVNSDAISGPHVSATYQIAFSGQYYGTYTVTAATRGQGAVMDANGNALASSAVGTFDISPPIQPTFAPTITLSGQFPQTAVSGAKGPRVKVKIFSENGFDLPGLGDCIVTLAASPTSTFTSNSIILGQVERHLHLRAHSATISFKNWNYPAAPGNYFIVANVDSLIPVASSPSGISVKPPSIFLDNLWNGANSNNVENGKIDTSFEVVNEGNTTAKGIVLIDLLATSRGYGTSYPMTGKARVNIAPGNVQSLHLHLVLPNALPLGKYDLSLTLAPLTGFDGISFTSNTAVSLNSIDL